MIRFYEDKTHIRDYQALHTSWFLRGKQKQIPTYGRHANVTLFGTRKYGKWAFALYGNYYL